MKRLLVVGGFAVIAGSAQAQINLNLDNFFMSGAQGSTLTFTGTIDVADGWDVTGLSMEFPSNTSSVFLGGAFHNDLLTYMAPNNDGVDYSGNLFTINIPINATPGLYFLNAGGISPLSEFFVSGFNSTLEVGTTDNETYMVEVTPVPEPATLAALGIGAAALIRRRKR